MLPVYVLPEHFPSKARQTICNNPNRHSPMGMDGKGTKDLKMRCYLWLLNQPKYLTPFSDGSIARLDEKGSLLVGTVRTDFHSVDRTLGVKENCGGLKYQSKCKGWWIFFCLYVSKRWQRMTRNTGAIQDRLRKISMHVKYLITCLYTVQRLSVCSLDCGWSGVL